MSKTTEIVKDLNKRKDSLAEKISLIINEQVNQDKITKYVDRLADMLDNTEPKFVEESSVSLILSENDEILSELLAISIIKKASKILTGKYHLEPKQQKLVDAVDQLIFI